MEWRAYIEQLLAQPVGFDGLSLSLGDTGPSFGVPPIIKASVLMLDKMMDRQGQFNVLVFPEKVQSIFIFTLVKLLYNISEGRINRKYNPEKFQVGERLRLGKAVVEYLGITEKNGKKMMSLRLADIDKYSAPIEFFPLFQKTTAQKLSRNIQFVHAKREAESTLQLLPESDAYLSLLADYKTHMENSIINMTSVVNAKDLLSRCKICGRPVREAILVGQADYQGKIKNIGTGQLAGTPAIVLASDLYSVREIARASHPIQSLIIDGSNAGALASQLDKLDELMRLNVPITCVTDTANSFDLRTFLDRSFNVWRWDESSITPELYGASPLVSDHKIKNCEQRKVHYKYISEKEISASIQLLSRYKQFSETFSAQMLKVYEELFSLTFSVLRETVPYNGTQLIQMRQTHSECKRMLGEEKFYLAPEVTEAFEAVISFLQVVLSDGFILPKNNALQAMLKEGDYDNVTVILPEQADKQRAQVYWEAWLRQERLHTQISVLNPAEYYSATRVSEAPVIIVGWLKRAIMRKILYSFNSSDYTVLLYGCEKNWKNYTASLWNRALNSEQNRRVVEKSFASDRIKVSVSRFVSPSADTEPTPDHDEFAEIETARRENKYRRYVASGGTKAANETTEAIPIGYVGGYMAFYRLGHKIVSATNTILKDADKIEMLPPEKIGVGDFVVVRETDHDLIRELADIRLAKEGKLHLRETASKWKEALEIEQLFNTPEQIYDRLKDVGFDKGFPTIVRWLSDDDMIAPQSKQDLEYIATITGNEVLKELLDQIYDAAQTVRSAHIQAGKDLSDLLRNRIVEALNNLGDIDPFNIWEPLEMQIEGVGLVRILKVIDKGEAITVDIANTNRLIEER